MSRKWKLVLGMEGLILAVILISVFLPKYRQSFDASELSVFLGEYKEGEGVVTEYLQDAGYAAVTPKLHLGYGTYKVEVDYATDSAGNMLIVSLPDVMNGIEEISRQYYADSTLMEPYMETAESELLVKWGRSDYMAAVFYKDGSYLNIKNIRVTKTGAGSLRLFVVFLTAFAAADALCLLMQRHRAGKVSDAGMFTGFALLAIIVFASVPLFLDYIVAGHDLTFHLLRIEGIREGIRMGEIPVRIQSNWLAGNGYAVSVFYGDLFLYIPAVLRLCGFTVTEAYNIYVFLVNIATCLISYCCFKRMSGSTKAALAGSALYTLSLYRLIDIYVRSSVGEFSAMIFLPLLAYGFWKIFTEEPSSEGYKTNWILPVIGFTGIINTHVLTCELVALFVILLCIIFIKKVMKKRTFLVLAKIVIFTCLVNLAFLVPFLDYMMQGGVVVTDNKGMITSIQKHGAFIGQLLVPFSTYSGLSENCTEGMAQEIPVSMGLSLILSGALSVLFMMMGYMKEKKERIASIVCLCFGAIAIVLSTCLFPWDAFQRQNRFFESMILVIQYPWRLLAIAMVVLSAAAVLLFKQLDGKKYFWGIFSVLIATAVIQGGTLLGDIMNHAVPFRVYTSAGLDDLNVIGGEYLPSASVPIQFSSRYSEFSENLDYEELQRENNRVRFAVRNNSAQEGEVKLSTVYYKGYAAVDTETGKRLEVFAFDDAHVGVKIPAGYSGTVQVRFKPFWYWQTAVAVSVITVVGLTVFPVRQKFPWRKRQKKSQEVRPGGWKSEEKD